MDKNKRAPLRQHYEAQANQAQSLKQHSDRTAQIDGLESTVITAFNTLIRFMDGKTSKTEVVNQLKSISTPDVDKVVTAISKLDDNILTHKLDLKPLETLLNGVKREVSLIPKSHPKPVEQRDSIKVTNLSEVKLDTSALEKAVKALKLDPTIDVKAPIINVDAPNLKPLQDVMLDLLKAVNKQEYPETPVTDLSTLEKNSLESNKKLDLANKHLKAIVDKPVGGGGGGGGNGTPYITSAGKASYVTLNADGSIPTSSGASGGLTDTQLRATPVPVSGTVAVTGVATAANQLPNNHNVVVTSAPTTAVTGTFYQATQPVSAATLPLPSGAATSANQTTSNSSLSTIVTNTGNTLTDTQLRATPVNTADINRQSTLAYSAVLTAGSTLTPTSGKKLKIVKVLVLPNPDNATANLVSLSFVSLGTFLQGWVYSSSTEWIGATNEVMTVTLGNVQPISINVQYKEIT